MRIQVYIKMVIKGLTFYSAVTLLNIRCYDSVTSIAVQMAPTLRDAASSQEEGIQLSLFNVSLSLGVLCVGSL